jgi:hypothetical protein
MTNKQIKDDALFSRFKTIQLSKKNYMNYALEGWPIKPRHRLLFKKDFLKSHLNKINKISF